jgi:hypothetical protein
VDIAAPARFHGEVTTAATRTPFVVLPGIYDSGPAHWQTRWEQSLHGLTRFTPSDWDHPRGQDWCDALERAVRASGEPPVLIAHSLACLLVPMWAETSGAPVAGAMLVAPVDPAADAFPPQAREIDRVPQTPLRFPALVVGSRNDPYATAEYSSDLAAVLGAGFVDAGALGHINADSGLGDWPQGQHLLAAFCAGLGVAPPSAQVSRRRS